MAHDCDWLGASKVDLEEICKPLCRETLSKHHGWDEPEQPLRHALEQNVHRAYRLYLGEDNAAAIVEREYGYVLLTRFGGGFTLREFLWERVSFPGEALRPMRAIEVQETNARVGSDYCRVPAAGAGALINKDIALARLCH